MCVASILEMDTARVPNFVGRHGGRWLPRLEEWLGARGMYFQYWFLQGGLSDPLIPKGYWIAIVDEHWPSRECHAIVMHGKRKAFDPAKGDEHLRRHYERALVIVKRKRA